MTDLPTEHRSGRKRARKLTWLLCLILPTMWPVLGCEEKKGKEAAREMPTASPAVAREKPDGKEMPAPFMSLHGAVEAGDLVQVRSNLYWGADIDAKDAKGRTPLHLAVLKGHVAVVEFLLDEGADPNARGGEFGDTFGGTPLHTAVTTTEALEDLEDMKTIVELLLAKGGDVNAKDSLDETALDKAGGPWSSELGALLLRKGGQASRPLPTALVEAISWEHWAEAKRLLQEGADPNATDRAGCPALLLPKVISFYEADEVEEEKREVIKLLLAKGADVNARSPSEGLTPLHNAACANRTDLVQLFLDNGVDPNAKDNDGKTPLHVAARSTGEETLYVIRALLANGANPNVGDNNGRTPLHIAVHFHASDVVRFLVVNGAKVNIKDKYGQTPLHLAAGTSSEAQIELLLDNGADANARDNDGRMPLHLALSESGPGAAVRVKVLLDNGADLEARDGDGRTPLLLAASNKDEFCMGVLLQKGADPNASDKHGTTALHLVVSGKSGRLPRLLLNNGAKPNVTDDLGRTPLALARDEYIKDLLRKYGASKE